MSAILAAVFSLSAAVPPPEDPVAPTMRVRYAEADLATAPGRASFRIRLDQATHAFCAVHRVTVTPQHVRTSRYCERTMRSAAIRQLPLNVRRQLAAD
jgi:UrcA family protein